MMLLSLVYFFLVTFIFESTLCYLSRIHWNIAARVSVEYLVKFLIEIGNPLIEKHRDDERRRSSHIIKNDCTIMKESIGNLDALPLFEDLNEEHFDFNTEME